MRRRAVRIVAVVALLAVVGSLYRPQPATRTYAVATRAALARYRADQAAYRAYEQEQAAKRYARKLIEQRLTGRWPK